MTATRIDPMKETAMVAVALGIDLIQALLDFAVVGLLLDSAIDVVAAFIFHQWFASVGYDLGKKQSGAFIATVVFGFVPGLNIAPEWTVFVRYSIRQANRAAAV